jgi:hypothetical protein
MHSHAQPVVLIELLLLVGKPVLQVLAPLVLAVQVLAPLVLEVQVLAPLVLEERVGQLLELAVLVLCSYWPKNLVQ